MGSSDLNHVLIVGRLVRDPELHQTQGGKSIASFSIATNYVFGSGETKRENVSFFSCVAWSNLGEMIVKYCKKGNRVGLSGRLQQKSFEDKNGVKQYAVEIVVNDIQFLSPKKGDDAQMNIPKDEPENTTPISDEDIPF